MECAVNTSWTCEEDEKLLSSIIKYGFGNWEKISRTFQNRDALECEDRYIDRFVTNPSEPELEQILDCHKRLSGLCRNDCNLLLPYNPDTFSNNHSLARVLDKAANYRDDYVGKNYYPWKTSASNKESLNNLSALRRDNFLGISSCFLNGYNPNRSEFEVEFDDKAESIFPIINEDDDSSDFEEEEDGKLFDELRVALVDSYNLCLSERRRRKEIIRKHALLDRGKSFSVIQRYENVCGRVQILALLRNMRFLSGPEMDLFLEQLRYHKDLKVRINRLSAYRRLGIRHFDVIPMYEKLYRKRMKHKYELEMNASSITLGFNYQKRTAPPLDIHNLPCYGDLEDEEKELCSVSRIVPETYLSFKNLMIQECQKLDGLKLQQARQLFRIDVNKTRKMYDHLIRKKLIWLPKSK